jgi:hypothetical protein
MATPTSNTPIPLPTTDTDATDAVDALQDIINDGETAAENAIIAAEPFMATPVLKQIWEGALSWVFGFLSYPLKTFTGYVVIDYQKYTALKNASQALVNLKSAQTSGDPNALQQANNQMDSAIAPVLHYIGSVNTV